jgi:transposase
MSIRLRRKLISGHEYWYAVESVRVNGRPTTRHVAYLGRPEQIVARTRGAAGRIRSRSHGAVAALKALADRLEIAQTIDRHIAQRHPSSVASVGLTLLLAAIGRAVHPTSKRGFAQWANLTTLEHLFGVRPDELTSAFFWDQMDKVSPAALAAIEREILARAVREFDVRTDLLLYDTTNFFTYIASDNEHCDLPRRGKNKQRRNDLRQLALALLVSRDGAVPVGSLVYRGNRNDVSVFAEAFATMRQQLAAMAIEIESVTFVYDKGNVSKANQERLEEVDYVTSLVPSHHGDLLALEEAQAEHLADGTAVWRSRKELWGRERTVVMLVSEALREGQRQGMDQHLGKALMALEAIRQGLLGARRRRRCDAVQKAVAQICQSPQLRGILSAQVIERVPGYYDLAESLDMERYQWLCRHVFGRRLLVTTRQNWSTEDIVAAWRGQSHLERAFRVIKDPFHLAVRPQYHWTDQKIQVHIFCCLMGYLLGALMLRRLRQAGLDHSARQMLDLLEEVRLATVIEERGPGHPGRPTVTRQLEECAAHAMEIFRLFVPEKTPC